MVTCSECSIADPKDVFICDGCRKEFCKKCSDLTETEVRCYQLKKRRLSFLCVNCEQGLLCIPDILRQLNELKEEVNNLKKSLNEKCTTEISTNKVDPFESEDVIAEIIERQKRASNIMIANIKEPQAKTTQDRKKEDLNIVKDILKDTNVDLSKITVIRVGKYINGKNRLIKTILNNSEDAITVLKNKKNITVPGITIFADQTNKQRQYFKTVKDKLKELIENGDQDKTIKFINNKPTIVTKTLKLSKN